MTMRGFLLSFLALSLGFLAPCSSAKVFDAGDSIYVQTSLWTVHFNPDEDHSNNQRLINVELEKANHWVFGFALFQNSFDQPSQYVYGGYLWTLPKTRELAYFKLTGGILHGYTGEHEDAVPYNYRGFSPGILPSLWVKYKRIQSEIVLFGTAGLMWTLGVNFPLGSKK